MQLSEIKGERALEVIADLIDPITNLVKDKKFKAIVDSGTQMDVVKFILKEHPKEILFILATINDKDPATYQPTLIELPKMVLDLISDPDVKSLFKSQSQSEQLASSGSVTENIGAVEA